jgi:hypothetical protein
MGFDFRRHVFHSPQFHSVVDEAIEFFNNTPAHDLVPPDAFAGTGVYGLYYAGGCELYAEISRANQRGCVQPIYGKGCAAGMANGAVTGDRGAGSVQTIAGAR